MIIVARTLAIALALTGVIASSRANISSTASVARAAKTSAMPVPTCPPDGSTDCGIMGNGN